VTGTRLAHLLDRGVVSVTGDDAGKFLQGLLTNDMALLGAAPSLHAGLLTPQGKILFDFFVAKTPGGYLLETASDKVAELTKRLTMYKLRAAVEISDVSADYRVLAVWGGDPPALVEKGRSVSFADPRLPGMGVRILAEAQYADGLASSIGATTSSAEDYHAHRISLGVPEGGKDYPFGDTFPHEALFDQLRSVSFTKGCYVGQEVVSRMEHRGTARKRVVPVAGEAELPAPGAEIKAGEVTIGTLGSVAGDRGLALLRLDRAAEAIAKRLPLHAGTMPFKIVLPAFATFTLKLQPASA
jgi:folate-binding protein YgfZ